MGIHLVSYPYLLTYENKSFQQMSPIKYSEECPSLQKTKYKKSHLIRDEI